MATDWLNSEKGREHARELLRHAGIPLEVNVARLCREFSRRHNGELPRVTTLRPIYTGSRSSDAAREIDQSPQFDGYLDLSEHLGVRLRLRVPIECKHRRGMTVFGFPRPRGAREARLPTVSDYAGAVLVNQVAYSEPAIISKSRECSLTLLNSEKNHIHEEQLIHNAGAALYDFVRTVETRRRRRPDPLVLEHQLLERFRAFCGRSGDWFAHFRRFVRSIEETEIDSFNSRSTRQGKVYLEVSIHVPVICTDAPLFVVPCQRDGDLRTFLPAHLLMTGLRLAKWPGRLAFDVGRRSQEALVIICGVSGLELLLASCHEWYQDLIAQLRASDPMVLRRALLEGCLFRSTAAVNELRRRRMPSD